MGLDMYLTRKIHIGANYEHNNVKGVIDLERRGRKVPINLEKVTYIEEDAGYWRKANQIHKWFVDNVQGGNDDCGTYDVEVEQLKFLLKLCKEVKEKAIITDGHIKNGARLVDGEFLPVIEEGKVIQNADEISKILPTQSGFFFGDTDYNQYYMQDIEYTIKLLEEQLEREKELDKENCFSYLQYHSSW